MAGLAAWGWKAYSRAREERAEAELQGDAAMAALEGINAFEEGYEAAGRLSDDEHDGACQLSPECPGARDMLI